MNSGNKFDILPEEILHRIHIEALKMLQKDTIALIMKNAEKIAQNRNEKYFSENSIYPEKIFLWNSDDIISFYSNPYYKFKNILSLPDRYYQAQTADMFDTYEEELYYQSQTENMFDIYDNDYY